METFLKTRDRIEIIGLILQAVVGEPLTRSKIMYHTMLNFNQINHYTLFLIQWRLLTYQTLDRKYTITDKGRQFLSLFNETDKLLMTLDNDDYITSAEDDLQMRNQQPQQQKQQQEVTVHK